MASLAEQARISVIRFVEMADQWIKRILLVGSATKPLIDKGYDRVERYRQVAS
jgi:hypothetical protein